MSKLKVLPGAPNEIVMERVFDAPATSSSRR